MEIASHEKIRINSSNYCFDGDFVLKAIKKEDYFVNDECPENEEFKQVNFDNFCELTRSKKNKHSLCNSKELINYLLSYSNTSGKKEKKPLYTLGKRFQQRIRNGSSLHLFDKSEKHILASSGIFEQQDGWSAIFSDDNKNKKTKSARHFAKFAKLHLFDYDTVFNKDGNVLSTLMNEKRKKGKEISNSIDFFYPFEKPSRFYMIYDPYLFSAGFRINKIIKGKNKSIRSNQMLGHFDRKKTFGRNTDYVFDSDHMPKNKNDFKSKLQNEDVNLIIPILDKFLRYVEWIHDSHFLKNNKLSFPYIYFLSKIEFHPQKWHEIEAIGLSYIFIEKILKIEPKTYTINRQKFIIKPEPLNYLKSLIKDNKLRLIPIPNKVKGKKIFYKQRDDILHDNCILTDYGYINWGNRDNGLKVALSSKKSVTTKFSSIFKSNEFDLREIFSFFNDIIIKSSEKINKVGNLFEIN